MVDFITAVGKKLQLTMTAEAQAGAGHDVKALDMRNIPNHADKLEPVDDVVKTSSRRTVP